MTKQSAGVIFLAILCLVACQSTVQPERFNLPAATSTHQPARMIPSPALIQPIPTTTQEIETLPPPATDPPVRETLNPTASPQPSASPFPARPWRIMPLGDSLTSGNYPGRVHSYRGYLEVLLREAGFAFDFVGTQSRAAHGGTDPDHEGHSGYTIGPDLARFCAECETANLSDHLAFYLETEPDIILLLIGINDLLPLEVRPVKPEEAPARLAALVERIQALRPNVFIFLASLAPVNYRDEAHWTAYQAVNQIAEAIAEEDANDRIYFVDVNRILEKTLDPATDFADGIHLAEGGARKLAQVWFEALKASGLLEGVPTGP